MLPALYILIISVLLISCSDDSDKATKQIIHDVNVITVKKELLPIILPVPGTVVTKEKLKIASRITGFIERVAVNEGDVVKPGDVLVEIDDAQVEANISGAEAAVSAAKAELMDANADVKRFRDLVKRSTISKDQLRNTIVRQLQADASLKKTKAELSAKLQERRYSTITSSVHAQVRERLHDSGELALMGEPILQLDVLGEMDFEVYLPSSRINKVSLNQNIFIFVEPNTKLLSGQIRSIVRSADEATRSYKVKIKLPDNENILPGQFGQAQFILSEEPVLVISESTIIKRAGIKGAFIVDETNTLRFRSIRLGRVWRNKHEVLSGLELDMSIVISPSDQLHEGDQVNLIQSNVN